LFYIDCDNLKQVIVFDLLGKKLGCFQSNSINIADLSPGLYIVLIETSSGIVSRQTVIRK